MFYYYRHNKITGEVGRCCALGLEGLCLRIMSGDWLSGLMSRCVSGIISFGFFLLVGDASVCISSSVVRQTSKRVATKLSAGGRVCLELHRICCVALMVSAAVILSVSK